MTKTDKLTALQNQVFSQMLVNPEIGENFSSGLKKSILNAGVIAVFSMLALSSQMAHADNALRTMLGVSAVTGFLSHNSKVPNMPAECDVRGVSGYVVGGATAAGSIIGNQMGKGSGKKWTTAILGGTAGTIALKQQEYRVEEDKAECYKRIAERNAASQMNHPQVMTVNNPENNILYTFTNNNFRGQQVVTMANSPGINALKGNSVGYKDPSSNPEASDLIQKSIRGIQASRLNFEQKSENFIGFVESVRNSPNYNVNEEKRLTQEFNDAFNRYSRERAFTAAAFNKLATENYNLTGYRYLLPEFTPPEKANIACQCVLPNRYSSVPTELTRNLR